MQAKEDKASEKARVVAAIAADVQRDVDEALAALDAALANLKALKKNDVTEVRDDTSMTTAKDYLQTHRYLQIDCHLLNILPIGASHAATCSGSEAGY